MTYHGQKVVTTSGTAVPLSPTSFHCSSVTIQPLTGNVGEIRLGGRDISTPLTPPTSIPSGKGLRLYPGDSAVAFPSGVPAQYDLAQIFIDCDVAGNGVDGVQFIAVR